MSASAKREAGNPASPFGTAQAAFTGFGLGLRVPHYADILDSRTDRHPDVDWFEVISENFFEAGGLPRRNLMRVRERYPVAMHGVSLSIGSTDPLDMDYLRRLKELADLLNPPVLSDHLCWTGAHGLNMHDLLPVPLTQESLTHVAGRVRQVQDILGRRIALENPSSYVAFDRDEMTEWDYLTELTQMADCDLLLDVNNVYVSSVNHSFDPISYLDGLPTRRIKQIHLAGHENNGDHIVDTHDAPVTGSVWALYGQAVARFGAIPTMIERDGNIPAFEVLVAELRTARQLQQGVLRAEPKDQAA